MVDAKQEYARRYTSRLTRQRQMVERRAAILADAGSFKRRSRLAMCLGMGVAFPSQLVCAWCPFLFLLFLSLQLDEVWAYVRVL